MNQFFHSAGRSLTRKAAAALAAGITCLLATQSFAWDYEAHRLINQLALTTLPTNFPAFVREAAAVERIGFLAGEPDRWRNVPDLPLRNASGPDHYLDLEQLADYGLTADTLPPLRGDYIAALALARHAHPEKLAAIDESRNADHTRELVGFVPWAMTENYSKLKSSFSYLRALEGGGTPEDVANAQANVIYTMGVMGHFIGDAAQPLHTTIHHHGWRADRVENPQHYTTNSGFHSQIDGFLRHDAVDFKALSARLRPAAPLTLGDHPASPAEVFRVGVQFVVEQNKLVEPLYKLEKEGKLAAGPAGAEGRAFLETQMLKAAQMLADTWLTAWQQAPTDDYLERQLSSQRNKRENSHAK